MSILGDIFGYINSGRAASSVSNADIAAEHGVLGATSNGQAGISSAVDTARQTVNDASSGAIATVNAGATNANGTLSDVLQRTGAAVSPYLEAGAQGTAGLQAYAASNPQFTFDPSKYINSDAYNYQLKSGQDAVTNQMSAQGMGASGAALKELTQYGQGLASTYYNQAFQQAQSQFQTNQDTTLKNLQTLIGAGEFGTQQFNSVNNSTGTQQASNLMNAGTWSGNNMTNVQEFLSQLGLGGAEASANLGLQGAKAAGDYAVGAGQAHASGIMNQGAALTSGITDLAGMLSPMVGSIPLPGGNATTLAGLMGG
jgi:hypothetical protein